MTWPRFHAPPVLVSVLLLVVAAESLAAQGLGGSLAAGVYRSFGTSVGFGAELTGRWASRAGIGVGLGARLIHSTTEDRGSAFVEVRYAPAPSPVRRVRPVIGVRAGPFRTAGEFDDDPLFGLEGGPIAGLALRAGPRVSLTLAGDLRVILDGSHSFGEHRVLPGLQVGVTLH